MSTTSLAPTTSLALTTSTEPTSTTADEVRATTTVAPSAVEADYTVVVRQFGEEPRFELVLHRTPEVAVELTYVEEQVHRFSTNGRDQEPDVPLRTTTMLDLTTRTNGDLTSESPFTLKVQIQSTIVDSPESVPLITFAQRETLNNVNDLVSQVVGLWFEQNYSHRLDKRSPGATAPTRDSVQNEILAGYDQTLNLLQLAIPSEPLGVGAQWTTTTDAERAGLPISVSTTATISQITADLAVANIDILATFIAGDFDLAGQPAQLIVGQLHVTGTMTWSLGAPVALYELTGRSELHLRIDDDDAGRSDIIQTVEQVYSLSIG